MGLFSWACRITRLVRWFIRFDFLHWFLVLLMMMLLSLLLFVVAVLGFDRGMGGAELGRFHQWWCWFGNQWDCAVSVV